MCRHRECEPVAAAAAPHTGKRSKVSSNTSCWGLNFQIPTGGCQRKIGRGAASWERATRFINSSWHLLKKTCPNERDMPTDTSSSSSSYSCFFIGRRLIATGHAQNWWWFCLCRRVVIYVVNVVYFQLGIVSKVTCGCAYILKNTYHALCSTRGDCMQKSNLERRYYCKCGGLCWSWVGCVNARRLFVSLQS